MTIPTTSGDLFADIKDATLAHLHEHGCGCYPYSDGSLLATLTAATSAGTVVEIGTAFGYSTAWFASTGAWVYTIDRDPTHSRAARDQLTAHTLADQVEFHVGEAVDVLKALPTGRADVAFFDGFPVTRSAVAALTDVLRPGGLLIAGNMTLGGDASQVRASLTTWQRTDLGETLLAVKPRDQRFIPQRRSTQAWAPGRPTLMEIRWP
jgi:predicted O-methyltransferase YrrM